MLTSLKAGRRITCNWKNPSLARMNNVTCNYKNYHLPLYPASFVTRFLTIKLRRTARDSFATFVHEGSLCPYWSKGLSGYLGFLGFCRLRVFCKFFRACVAELRGVWVFRVEGLCVIVLGLGFPFGGIFSLFKPLGFVSWIGACLGFGYFHVRGRRLGSGVL